MKKILFGLAHDADIVLDLHCDNEAVLHVYLGTPLWPEGEDLSAQVGAEVTLLAKNQEVILLMKRVVAYGGISQKIPIPPDTERLPLCDH